MICSIHTFHLAVSVRHQFVPPCRQTCYPNPNPVEKAMDITVGSTVLLPPSVPMAANLAQSITFDRPLRSKFPTSKCLACDSPRIAHDVATGANTHCDHTTGTCTRSSATLLHARAIQVRTNEEQLTLYGKQVKAFTNIISSSKTSFHSLHIPTLLLLPSSLSPNFSQQD